MALLALACMVSPLHAEPAAIVSLSSIGDRIRAQNPDLTAARLRIREAVGRMKQSGRPANPELETSLEHNPRFREGKFEIGISQRFPVTNRLRLEKEISLTEVKTAEAEVRDVERQLIGQAREAVVKILATRQRRELLREQSGVSGEFAKFLSEAAAKGEGSALDAGQAKLEAAGLSTEIRQLDASEVALVGELKPLLGMRPGESLSIGGTLPEPSLPNTAADPSGYGEGQVSVDFVTVTTDALGHADFSKAESIASSQAVTAATRRLSLQPDDLTFIVSEFSNCQIIGDNIFTDGFGP